MERELEELLNLAGAHKDTLSVLEKENVFSLSIFKALRDEHFGRLLPKMTVGQHVLLLNAWEDVNIMPDGPPDPKKGFISPASGYMTDLPYSPGSSSGSEIHVRQNVDQKRKSRLSLSLSPRYTSPSLSDRTPSPTPQHGISAKPAGHHDSSNVSELMKLYKLKAIDRYSAGMSGSKGRKQVTSKNKQMMVIIGGMIYDPSQERGVRKKFLPEPNPTKIDVPISSSFQFMQAKAKELYFAEYETKAEDLILSDSSGIPMQISSRDTWTVSDFYESHSYQPSKYKLYFMLDMKKELEKLEEDDQDHDGMIQKTITPPSTKRAESVTQECVQCSCLYRTYVPGIPTNLPDGGIVLYDEPQMLCPGCDPALFGLFMNEDLFPNLVVGRGAKVNDTA